LAGKFSFDGKVVRIIPTFDFQGLAKFYEQQEQWEKYVQVLTRLLDFSMKEFVNYFYLCEAVDSTIR
jgi:hypothetical protein